MDPASVALFTIALQESTARQGKKERSGECFMGLLKQRALQRRPEARQGRQKVMACAGEACIGVTKAAGVATLHIALLNGKARHRNSRCVQSMDAGGESRVAGVAVEPPLTHWRALRA